MMFQIKPASRTVSRSYIPEYRNQPSVNPKNQINRQSEEEVREAEITMKTGADAIERTARATPQRRPTWSR